MRARVRARGVWRRREMAWRGTNMRARVRAWCVEATGDGVERQEWMGGGVSCRCTVMYQRASRHASNSKRNAWTTEPRNATVAWPNGPPHPPHPYPTYHTLEVQ